MPNMVYEKDDLGASAQEGFLEEEACDLGLWGRVGFMMGRGSSREKAGPGAGGTGKSTQDHTLAVKRRG